MKSTSSKATKELYQQLRVLTCEQLSQEITRFDGASQQERKERVAVIRAVGVVFCESGTDAQKQSVRPWLRSLLNDPCEKVRRYAMAAIPKIGAGAGEEEELLALMRRTETDREKKFLGQALEKIGGAATLEEMEKETRAFEPQTKQKVTANIVRSKSPSTIKLVGLLDDFAGLKIHLRGRAGLETIVRDEVEESTKLKGKFRVSSVQSGLVAIVPLAPFTLTDLYTLRCFGTVGFVLGNVTNFSEQESIEAIARLITSPLSRRILQTFTDGSIRYRLDFVSRGHQRGAVRLVANRAYALCPAIINDAREAPWTMAIYPSAQGGSVELSPKLIPDPRLYYRRQDVPAASHPPLAACMARLAGRVDNEMVWDPFCGSGLELIERALLGGVRGIYGTDLSAEAIAISRTNFDAANITAVESKFTCCDFRDYASVEGLKPSSVTLVITNPPLGMRIPVADLRGLIEDLLTVAARVLRPGGRLVFANPLRMESGQRSLKLQFRQEVDLGGFNCRLEKYVKTVR